MNATAILERLRSGGIHPQGLTIDSRRVAAGDVFLAWPGARTDGRRFIADAVAAGAAAVVYEAEGAAFDENAIGVAAIPVAGLAALAGELADQVYGQPSAHVWLVGVTGTNGKTSITQWVAQALESLDPRCAVIGTLGNGFPGSLASALNTTPDAITLHRLLAEWRQAGAKACAMEVSSIGLVQGRVNGARFRTAVFTNLTRDHLEDHGTMAAYGEAKARLFAWPGLEQAVINLDDAFGRELAKSLKGRVPTWGYTLGEEGGTDVVLKAEGLRGTAGGQAFTVEGQRVEAPVVGRFNVSNLLAVFAVLRTRGVDAATAAAALARLRPPPGRMQALGGEGRPLVVVDYAHTPDALLNALTALRQTAEERGGRLLCLFGCGGDRDPGKRPEMGAIAEAHADQVIVTSDNPRRENPDDIIAGILGGLKTSPRVIPDRRIAIAEAIGTAAPEDVVLLAGKGHEPYQEIAGQRLPFSDLEHARLALEAYSC